MSVNSDVIVIGAGVVGLSVALELRSRGLEVSVLHYTHPLPASDKSAGILFPNSPNRINGPEGEFNIKSISQWHDWQDFLERDLLQSSGFLQVFKKNSVANLAAVKQAYEKVTSVKYIDGDQAEHHHDLLGPVSYTDIQVALWLEDVLHVDPLELLEALRYKCAQEKIIIRHMEAQKMLLDQRGKLKGIVCQGETFKANWVVGACGWTGWGWADEHAPMIVPQQGERIILKTNYEYYPQPVLSTGQGSIICRKNGTIWAGVTAHQDLSPHPNVEHSLHILNNIVDFCPSLRSAQVINISSGARPMSKDKLPWIGLTKQAGLLLAAGSGRSGILQSPLIAKIISSIIIDNQEPEWAYSLSPLSRFID